MLIIKRLMGMNKEAFYEIEDKSFYTSDYIDDFYTFCNSCFCAKFESC